MAKADVERENIKRLYTKLVLPEIPVFVEAAHCGVPLDETTLVEQLYSAREELKVAARAFALSLNTTPERAISLANSPTQTMQYLRETLGRTIDRANKDDLQELAIDHPIVAQIRTIRYWNKRVGTYFQPWLELIREQSDGRLHSVYRITSSRTGRTSAEVEKGASLQLATREGGVKKAIRARPGRILVAADFCLHGDTRIQTVNGLRAIRDVQAGDYVFGTLNRQPVVRKVLAARRVGILPVVNLRTTGGDVIATPEHRFQMLDSSYKRVEELQVGDRLLALRRYKTSNGYYRLTTLTDGPTGNGVFQYDAVAEGVFGPKPPKHAVHHRDGDKTNDSPTNLEVLPVTEHAARHTRERWASMTQDERLAVRRPWVEKMHAAWDARGGKGGEQNPNYGNFKGDSARCMGCEKEFYAPPCRHQRYCSRACYYEARRAGLNHKVTAIEPAGIADVYCIEVEECNNFALENGLISHNSNIEMRIAAWLANERRMLQLFNENADLHRATAAFIKAFQQEHISVAAFWPRRQEYMPLVTAEERQSAKGVNFGFLYSMQAPKFIAQAKAQYGVTFTLQEAEEAREGYFALYSDLQAWHDSAAAQLAKGYVVTPFGRYRRNLEDERKVINTPVQSTATDLATFAMTELARRRHELSCEIDICGFVHDSTVTECDEADADEVAAYMKEVMEHPDLARVGVEIPVPLAVDIVKKQALEE